MLLEDQAATRLILVQALLVEPTFDIAATFTTAGAASTWLDTHAPDILLADLYLQDGVSIEVIRKCSQKYPHCQIMVLTGSDDLSYVNECIDAGAHGYRLKEDGLTNIAQDVLELVNGGSPMSPSVARRIIDSARTYMKAFKRSIAAPINDLTEREVQVLQLLEEGHTYEECARRIGISVLTFQNHIKKSYRKLAVNTRGQAIKEAKRLGVLH